MPTAKQRAVAAVRRLGLLGLAERGRFALAAFGARRANAAFLRQHPDFQPPPLWWMHDMYAHARYDLYARSGAETAAALSAIIDRHVGTPSLRVADWGCGLARVLRHLPDRYDATGFDYNPAAIDWCRGHIRGPRFAVNKVSPPLPAEAGSFDALYALSVFTHLSEEGHAAWMREARRVLRPGGVFIATFHASPAAGQLLSDEQAAFDAGRLVVRGGVREGARTFTAFHPPDYIAKDLFAGWTIVDGPQPFFGQTLYAARPV